MAEASGSEWKWEAVWTWPKPEEPWSSNERTRNSFKRSFNTEVDRYLSQMQTPDVSTAANAVATDMKAWFERHATKNKTNWLLFVDELEAERIKAG